MLKRALGKALSSYYLVFMKASIERRIVPRFFDQNLQCRGGQRPILEGFRVWLLLVMVWHTCLSNANGDCNRNPCQNGGACSLNGDNYTYTCACATGYNGTNCTTSDCNPNPCQNGGTCSLDGDNYTYTCACATGYNGTNCTTNIDDCDPNPCQNGATCTDAVNDYNCTCVAGHYGKNCSQSACYDTRVGVRDDLKVIPDGSMSASSNLANFSASDGRLAGTGAWCPNVSDNDPYLTIYLGQSYVICGVEVQGKPGASESTKFTLKYSTDGTNFSDVDSGQIFYASSAGGDVTTFHTLNTSVTATHLRFKPVSNDICLRVEIYAIPGDCDPNPCQNGGNCSLDGDTYTCACATGYNGTNCTINVDDCYSNPCENRGNCTDAVYDYNCTCMVGYKGKNCSENIDDCYHNPCENEGNCTDTVNDYNCTCMAGYYGKNCSQSYCDHKPCRNGGTCLPKDDTYTCACAAGYNGTNCTMNIDDCYPNPCKNDGNCTDATNDYNCTCMAGYDGKNCSENIDDCSHNPCKNDGNCTDAVNDYNCTCMTGYYGKNCSQSYCDHNPCQNGGTCLLEEDTYTCACAAGYNGTNCTMNMDDCYPNPCENRGNCTDAINDYNCTCMAGYDGKNCSENINYCDPEPCENNATCTVEVNGYTCTCMPDYDGKNCSQKIDDCNPDPCENGATCTDNVNDFTCTCVAGYDGKNCSQNIDDCDPNPCENGATCIDGVNDYNCTCVAGYDGKNCTQGFVDDCASGPCKNGANCSDAFNDYICTCVAGYGGKDCDQNIDDCDPNPCENGGTCTDEINDYNCTCVPGYNGKDCENNVNECAPSPCQNNGTCTDLINDYTCNCTVGFIGKNCDIVDPCYNTNPCENDGQCFVDDNHEFFCVCPIPKAYEGRNCSKPVDCFWNKMYPYGKEQNDTEMDVRLIRDELCTEIVYDYGIWFFDDKHYVLYICANGMIRFDVGYARHFPVPTFDTEEFPFRVPMLFPFWSKIDLFDSFCSSEQDCLSGNIDYENRSAVFHKVYTEDKGVMNASHILYKASKDVRENSDDPKFDSFTASWVLVVTWLRLRPEEEEEGNAEEGVTNTFQAVLITDGTYTFLKYHYPCNALQWASPKFYELFPTEFSGYPVAGINAGDGNLEDTERFFSLEGSASPGITSLDLRKENADKDGEYFFRLERRTGDDPETKCRKWSDWQETNLKPEISIADNFIPGCPCTFDQAFFSTSYFLTFFPAPFSICFESISDLLFNKVVDSSSANGFIFRKCCYSTFFEDFGALLTDSNDAGSLEVLYRNKPEDLLDDAEAKQACCVDSFSCQLYDDLRPTDDCGSFFIPPRRWFWGDPHFKTLDDKNYTFNGVGEYTMVDGKDGKFKLQARTVLAPGNLSIATVFSAGAAQENGSSKVEVRVKSGGGVQMYINGALYAGLDNLTSVSKDIGGNLRAAKKNPGCVEVTFKSGSGVEFCEAKGMMSFVVTLGNEFLNNTKGLLGTYNNNPDDDFTLPNGNVLDPNSNSSTIHYDFGLKWQITADESLFTYGPNESVHTFANASFKPMFVEEIKWADNATQQAAEKACGDDAVCLFDAASTNDVSIGTNSKDVNVKLVKENEKLANFPPRFTYVPSVIEATVGEVLWVNVTAKDNNSFTFNIIKKPQGATFTTVGQNLLNFTWNVTSKEKVKFSITATDEFNASVSHTPTIKMCACESNGQCVKPAQGDKLNNDSKFIIQGCTCKPGFTGRFCESDIDACKVNGHPCFKGVTCTDKPAPANLTGFTCGSCPTGYSGNGIKCADIDECKNNSANQCQQQCVNNPGSYSCKCNSGFKLNSNGFACDDINECEPTSDCMHQCNNTEGSYECYCNDFFEVDPSNPKSCRPSNPCNNSDCDQICFKGQGNTQACDCNAGYKLANDKKTCEDIDECKIEGVKCTQKCENKVPGYDCKCYPGYKLDADGFTCSDINECLNSSLFSCPGKSRVCENIPGNYTCKCQNGLFYLNDTCTALKPGEKPPEPTIPPPKVASETEKQNALEIKLQSMTRKQYNASVDENFRTTCAKSADTFCQNDKAACGITSKRRRRSIAIITKDNVHLLPGFPVEEGNSLKIAFYIVLPSFLKSIGVIPVNALATVINNTKSELEQVFGVPISEIKLVIVPTTPSPPTTTSNVTTAPPTTTTSPVTITTTEKTSDDWKWIVIGVCVGVAVIVIIVVIVLCVKKQKNSLKIITSHQALRASDENYNQGAVNHGHEMTVYHGQQPMV